MANSSYWKDVITKLLDENKASWAAHVLSSNIQKFDDILLLVDKETLIKNCLLCYNIAFSAQPDLDAVLTQFSLKELINAYKTLDKKPIQTAGALMWLLEDIDPDFNWVDRFTEPAKQYKT